MSSERKTLHLVVQPPWAGDALCSALAHCRANDVVVLLQEAAPVAAASVVLDAALHAELAARTTVVLTADLFARGLGNSPLREGCAAIDDAGLVRLAVECHNSVTWY